jgi:chloramphenicol 3-O-phosphotransferase
VSARARPDPGLVVVLDGPSGVGTSTTLAALQEAWPRVRTEPLLDVGLDRTLTAFGPELDRWWDLLTPVTSPRQRACALGPLGRELIGAMHRVVATWASAGWDVASIICCSTRPPSPTCARPWQACPCCTSG